MIARKIEMARSAQARSIRPIRTVGILVALTASSLFSVSQASPPIEQVAWLTGCWSLDGADAGSVEHWLAPAAGTMFGVNRTVKGSRVAQFEFMSIRTTEAGNLVFVAQPGGAPPTEFPAVSVNATEVIFQSGRTDFPNRVIYRNTGADSMLGRIEGSVDGKALSVDFPFTRIPCAGRSAEQDGVRTT